jgi:hypothetical protein
MTDTVWPRPWETVTVSRSNRERVPQHEILKCLGKLTIVLSIQSRIVILLQTQGAMSNAFGVKDLRRSIL